MAAAFGRGGLRTGRVVAHSLPGPLPRRRGMPRSGLRPKRPDWPALAGAARTVCTVTAHASRAVARLAAAHRWMGHDKVHDASTTAQRGRCRAREMEAGLTLVATRRAGRSGGIGAEAVAGVRRGNDPGERRGTDRRLGGSCGCCVGAEKKKHGAGGDFGQRRARFPFKGWDDGTQRRGLGESGDTWRAERGERERERARAQRGTAWAAGIGSWWVWAAVLPRRQWRAVECVRLTGGTGRPRGPVGSYGVRASEAARQRC
jgi:hypothetical protein